ncbi:RNA polymerase sigma factor [Woeseia oceani]|uniref:RNA polymerase subunit sigma-24 n=1 Tax=Woeseia oceani TaxID=1548547 RepID=A0A193LJY9_9GAMM|nr:RNA polymerase sigma factor [Woeseia oceani]ANO52771.1 hypothetical protein BA177_17665 [Woeseia oceani]
MAAVLKRGNKPTQAEFHAAISSRSDRWFAACLRITRSRELAEDAVQDALLSAWNKREQFQQGAQLSTWIHRIAINSALQLIRKQRPGRFTALDMDIESEEESPEESKANIELAKTLTEACAHLSEIERVCFLLKHMEEWRLKEIAESLETNEGTVKQAIFRAVKKLRVRLGGLERNAS